jgi:hypothetical protein
MARDCTNNISLMTYSPDHRWHYLSDMTPEEVFIFKNYDSKKDIPAWRLSRVPGTWYNREEWCKFKGGKTTEGRLSSCTNYITMGNNYPKGRPYSPRRPSVSLGLSAKGMCRCRQRWSPDQVNTQGLTRHRDAVIHPL